MKADLHTHTYFSHDSEGEIDAMCQTAIQKGLSVLAFTDHFDMWETHLKKGSTYDAAAAQKSIFAAKEKYKSELQILFGVELGEPVEFHAEAQALLAEYPFEFVIGSLHAIPGDIDIFYTWGEQNPPQEKMRADFSDYLDALAEVAGYSGIHTLAHITYPLRYAAQNGKSFELTPFLPKIDRVLKILIEKQIALEINTSGLRQKIGTTMPDTEIAKRYYDLGGRLLTLGSDAHRAEDVGEGIAQTEAVMRAIGFEHVMYVVHGEQKFCKIG